MSPEHSRTSRSVPSPVRLRVVICWTNISGYMAACWQALHARPDIDLHVIAMAPGTTKQTAFDEALMGPVAHTFVTPDELHHNTEKIAAIVRNLRPDIIVVPGWVYPSYNALPFQKGLTNVQVAMTMDTPFRGTLRQRFGRFRHPRLFPRISRIVVPGERGTMLAKVLGFKPNHVVKGVYGVDFASRGPTYEARRKHPDGWPKQFLYMGRYAEEKCIDVLVDGYKAYRSTVKDPWPLVCMGKGEMASLLQNVPGITDLGFVQPGDQPKILAESSLFVLASNYDPWPLVIVESCAAGLPILCTEACGSAVELVRPFFNGRIIATEDRAAMTEALGWMHNHHAQLPEMGRRSRELASAYTAEMWAERWVHMFNGMVNDAA
ncbi:MAG: glycosyltransferase family 4 protein [bacterium]|nr:glycosyltransferase family 4 protein [bacterium]